MISPSLAKSLLRVRVKCVPCRSQEGSTWANDFRDGGVLVEKPSAAVSRAEEGVQSDTTPVRRRRGAERLSRMGTAYSLLARRGYPRLPLILRGASWRATALAPACCMLFSVVRLVRLVR